MVKQQRLEGYRVCTEEGYTLKFNETEIACV